jgi:predicted PurR-regulated permease PerM
MISELTPRQRRWVDTLLVLGVIVLSLVVLSTLTELFFYYGDVVLVFFLAWLVAFVLSPMVDALVNRVPRIPRAAAVGFVYALILTLLVLVIVLIAGALVTGIRDFLGSQQNIQDDLPSILAPWQERLDAIGLGQVDLAAQASGVVNSLSSYATQLLGPLQQLAFASIGALGNVLIIVILSVYIVIDRDQIMSFLFRMVPPGHQEEARLLESSVSRSFGGFLRGQAAMGIIYGGVALLASIAGGLPLVAVTTVASGLLQSIPFFGPFVSWLPPVAVAVIQAPNSLLPVLAIMAVGWFFVMNVLQPRLMQGAVGIHPIVVLGSVLIGAKAAGIAGAIFAIPIAAVISAFFFHYLRRTVDTGSVTSRAARRLEERSGRPVRIPREPAPGLDPDVDDKPMAHPEPGPAPGTAPSSSTAR